MNNIYDFTNKAKGFILSHKYLTSFICGILFATPFMLEWLFPLTFIGLIIFFYSINNEECIEKSSSKKVKKRPLRFFKYHFVFLFGACLTVYTLFFKLFPIEGYDFTKGQEIGIVIFAWFASSIIHGVMGGVILNLSRLFKSSPVIYAAACGALWVIFEHTLSLGFLAFPWINISVALVRFLPFLQTASLFGNGIITFITVFSCCCIGLFLIDKQKKVLIKTASIVLTFNLVLGSIIFIIPEKRGKEVSACVIQGNVTMGEKWQFGVLTSVIKEHENLIRSALNENECDVVLMAETVFPATYSKNGLIHQTLSKIAKEYNVTIIFGVILKAEDDGSYNAMMAIYPDGSTSEPYIKRQLVPFGEKLPSFDLMGKIVPALRELEGGSSYVEGTESINIPSHDGTIYGPLVCYDSVFPEFSRENVLNGAEIIAVSTNDSWYKDGKAVRQHQSQSCIRAIEAGRYVFRSANTGISCVINSKGKISEESEILKKDYVCAMGYEMNHKTLYVLFGNTSLYFSFVFIGILFLCKIYKKVIKERKN